MDANRLGSVIDLIVAEHNRLAIDHKFAEILQTLASCASKPSSASDEQFRAGLTSLVAALRRSRTNDLVESDRRILMQISGDRHTGDGLADRIVALANERPFLAARAKEQYVRLAEDLAGYLATLAAAQSGLRQLNVDAVRAAGDHYELGILLPERVGTGDLGAVISELRTWDEALRGLLSLVTASKTPVVRLRNFSSGHFELAVQLEQESALAFGTVVGGIYGLYRKVQANRRNADELGKQNYPPEIITQVKAYEPLIIQHELKSIKEALLGKYVRKGGKRKEIDKVLDRALRFLVLRIREGADLEILGPAHLDASDSPGEMPGDDSVRALPHHIRSAIAIARQRDPETKSEGEERRLPLSHITGEVGSMGPAAPAEGSKSEPPQKAA